MGGGGGKREGREEEGEEKGRRRERKSNPDLIKVDFSTRTQQVNQDGSLDLHSEKLPGSQAQLVPGLRLLVDL
jgi:hypothetical protein